MLECLGVIISIYSRKKLTISLNYREIIKYHQKTKTRIKQPSLKLNFLIVHCKTFQYSFFFVVTKTFNSV